MVKKGQSQALKLGILTPNPGPFLCVLFLVMQLKDYLQQGRETGGIKDTCGPLHPQMWSVCLLAAPQFVSDLITPLINRNIFRKHSFIFKDHLNQLFVSNISGLRFH